MKNYSHQAVSLTRIRRTLAVIASLAAKGADVDDDGFLGYALARAQAYTFRGLRYDADGLGARLEDRIEDEQRKPPGSQGARTFARELRRTLRDLSWLAGDNSPTTEGAAFLDSPSGSQEERDVLAAALWNFELHPGPSHPVRILLRLLALKESHSREGLELALEAQDDSEEEFQRVAQLYILPGDARAAALRSNGATDYQIANARKVFPSLALAAGLITESRPRTYQLSDAGRALLGAAESTVATDPVTEAARRSLRSVNAETIATALGASTSRTLTAEEQIAVRRLLAERTRRHHTTVQQLAALLTPGTIREGTVDLLWESANAEEPLILVEVKTVDGDAHSQVRYAYGQLTYYEYFDVRPIALGKRILLVVATDEHVPVGLGDYLEFYGVALITVRGDTWFPRNSAADALRPYLVPPRADP